MDSHFDARGYKSGPTLPPDVSPWDFNWEQDPHIDDGHAHDWETVHLLADGKWRVFEEDVVRCAICHCPRCGHSKDNDPCMERRHHRDLHIYLSGWFAPLGGSLREE